MRATQLCRDEAQNDAGSKTCEIYTDNSSKLKSLFHKNDRQILTGEVAMNEYSTR